MIRQKKHRVMLWLMLSAILISVSLTAILLMKYESRRQFETLEALCGEIIKMQPSAEQAVIKSLKTIDQVITPEPKNILQSFGYASSDFAQTNGVVFLIAVFGLFGGGGLFLFLLWYWNRKTTYRIRMLTDYLEKVNAGSQGLLMETTEDDFSKLQDEIYKTVTVLYQTRESALEAKNNFADNLSNIAHQLKTPITVISLATQMMKREPSQYLLQIDRQLSRLTCLEEALLLLARIDSGTLSLQLTSVDVFTVLNLAADNLQELFEHTKVAIDIPESGEVTIHADLEWTMEAIINLLKNCMEHSPEGTTVHCSYEVNPLYVQIRIWDEGEGFVKEDMPYLFERFYRGKTAKKDSIGIGLSLAREIIEMQNGILSASNLLTRGACFEIRFYSH